MVTLAASLGSTLATNTRDIVAKKMTPSQLAEAQTLARECVPTKYGWRRVDLHPVLTQTTRPRYSLP